MKKVVSFCRNLAEERGSWILTAMVNDGEREGAKSEAGLYVYWLDGTWDAGRRVRRRIEARCGMVGGCGGRTRLCVLTEATTTRARMKRGGGGGGGEGDGEWVEGGGGERRVERAAATTTTSAALHCALLSQQKESDGRLHLALERGRWLLARSLAPSRRCLAGFGSDALLRHDTLTLTHSALPLLLICCWLICCPLPKSTHTHPATEKTREKGRKIPPKSCAVSLFCCWASFEMRSMLFAN